MPKSLIVFGGGLAGLSAAIHARLRGMEVMLLERRDTVGGKAAQIHTEGFRLDPGPSIIILTEHYRKVFEAAGRNMDDYLRFSRLDPISRVIFEGDEPIDLPADREDCLETIGQFAPNDIHELRKLMDTLDDVAPLIERSIFAKPYLKPWQLGDPNLVKTALRFDVKASYKEIVDRMVQSPLLRAFFYGFPSYGGQTYDSKAPGALMIPYYMIANGVWWPEGGVGAIPRAYEKLAKELGVEIHTGVEVTGVLVERGRAVGVRTTQGEERADAVISGVDRLTVEGWLGRRNDPRPSLSYYTVHWGLRKPMPAVKHHTLLVPKDFENGFEAIYRQAKPPERPIVYLNETTEADPDSAPEGCSNLFAVLTVPAMEDHLDWDSEAGRLKGAIRRELDRFGMGFSDDDVIFERVQSPKLFMERDGSFKGSLYGPEESERLWGLFPQSNVDPSIKGLYYCGGSVQPGAGLPMVTLSGQFAVDQIK